MYLLRREVGGGLGMGNTCTPMTDSWECMAKTTTILQSNYPQIKTNKFKKIKNKIK